jgi:Mg2+ and Co2+ transporter CorA
MAQADPTIRLLLFEGETAGREIASRDLSDLLPIGDRHLLWVDVTQAAIPADLADRLGVDVDALASSPLPDIRWAAPWTYMRLNALNWQDERRPKGVSLTLAIGPNIVVTQHESPADFIRTVLDDESDVLRIGRLESMIFAASLLDRMLTDYLDARDEFENVLDRVELQILRKPHTGLLRDLQMLRQRGSRFRQALADHRDVFDALGRPDFNPSLTDGAREACTALRKRYSHVIGVIENARELVNGSFDLYSSRIAESTNATMHLLTVVTVITGLLATAAGVLGMNFAAPIFDTGSRGFYTAVASMLVFATASISFVLWRMRRSRQDGARPGTR